ncbi:MAG TPA: hypothetical protein VF702_00265 [Allosphingosinicella sp.]|jgi:hypothetical protein
MKRIVRATAALILASAALAAPAAAQPPAPPSVASQLRDACRAVRQVDRRRLPASEVGSASYHEAERLGSTAPPAGHRGPLIRLAVHHSRPPPSASWSLLAWKRGDGRWFVSRLVHAPEPGGGGRPALPWPHDPGIDTSDLPRSDWTLSEGTLASGDAARLEQLLDSRCLDREPAVRPHELPVRSGLTLNCYWHPTSYHLELSDRGRRRALRRECTSYQNASGVEGQRWASDLVLDFLGGAALEPAAVGPAAAPSAQPAEIPERFHGRWAQGVEQCTEPGRVLFDVGASGFSVNGSRSPVDRIEQRGARTLVVHGAGSGILQGAPIERFVQPLLLSPDGDRLFVPDLITGWSYRLHRCPAAP